MKSTSTQLKLTTIFGAVAVSAALACTLSVSPAHAVTAAEKEAEAQETLTQLNAMQAEFDEASNAYLQSLTDYEMAMRRCNETQERIDAITDEVNAIQGRLGNRAREMYRNGNTTFVDLLLGSASFEEFTQNWDLLNRVNETDATLSAQARDLREEAKDQKAIYAELAKVADEKAKEAAAAQQQAKVLIEQLQATYNALSEEARALYAQEQAAMYAAYYQANAPAEGGVVNDDGSVTDVQTGQTYASASEYVAATGNAIVDRARAAVGSAYVAAGVGGEWGGYDCSGLVSYALTGEAVRVGSSYTFATYNRVPDGEQQAGDIWVMDGHVGVYTGQESNTIVEAMNEELGVRENAFHYGSDQGFFVRP